MISSKKYLTVVILTLYFFLDEVCSIDFVVATNNRIQIFSNGIKKYTLNARSRSMTSVAYDSKEKNLFFNDSNEVGSIFRMRINKKTAYKVVVRKSPVQAIAYDTHNHELYWTSDDRIYFAKVYPNDMTPQSETFFYYIINDTIGGITFDEVKNYLYWWTTNGSPTYKIKRAKKNGIDQDDVMDLFTNTQSIMVEGSMVYRIDLPTDDSRSLHAIDISNYNNKLKIVSQYDRKELMPYVFTIGSKKVYWIDCKSGKIWSVTKGLVCDEKKPEFVFKIPVEDCPIGLFVLSDASDGLQRRASPSY